MNLCKKIIFSLLLLTGSFVSAKSFSLQIIQKNGSENVVYNASVMLEQTIMDYFYEHAYIVSNSPVIIQKKGQNIDSELQKSFDEAQEGSLDYIIEAFVYFNLSDSNNPEEALLSNIDKIEWKVVSLYDRSTIASGNAVPGKKYRNDDDGLFYFANELAEHIKKAIESKGGSK
ncbi:hypothetical protein [Treponema sp.]|uniref:hypothetical protein n=1 Tax=Treponema sp. TaxID=166 RepID=UPI00298DCADC|nr:hypothetical protein [Treponema sp.]MCR5612091.1 hypothetical protein [Treponema sp.]